MRYLRSCAVLIPLFCLPVPAVAQAAGEWRVSGDVSGRAFVVDCRFNEQGGELGGQCTEIDKEGKPGKQYRVSRGNVQGQQISWTYPTKVMMMSIDIVFAGSLNGDGMTGTVTAKGRKGTFTARKR